MSAQFPPHNGQPYQRPPMGGYNPRGYQQGGYQQSAPAQNNNPSYGGTPSNDALSIGNLADFEEVLSDDGVPF